MGIILTNNITAKLKYILKEMPVEAEAVITKEIKDAHAKMMRDIKSGLDINGDSFAPYSPLYKKWKTGELNRPSGKSKNTKAAQKDYSATPNMRLSGDMLAAIQSRTRRDGDKIIGVIEFVNQDEIEKANWHLKGLGNMPKREFFGISEETLAKRGNSIRNRLTRLIKGGK